MTREFFKGLERIFDIFIGVLFSAAVIASSPVILETTNDIGAVQLIVMSYFAMLAASLSCLVHSNWEE